MNNIKKYVKEIIFFSIFVFIFSNIVSFYKSSSLNSQNLNINTLQTINNKTYHLPRDKPIMIHIWALWCPICKLEADNIQSVSKDYEVITIAVKSGTDKEIKKYLLENNISFKVVNDIDGLLSSKFNIEVFPTTIIYNKNREMVFTDVGYTSSWLLKLKMWYVSI
ncbi:redoxin domain-containing protein [Sulfurimonas sp.]|nr:redoxin domain-containing protein [Sulfurimonas sp.]